MTLKSDAKFEEKLSCCLESEEKFGKFSPEHLKVPKSELWWNPFAQSRKCMNLKFMCHDNEVWYENWRGTDLSF